VRKLRLGVDVGGTFTDVVAVDAATRELVAKVKVPTTHDNAEGVAAGIIAGIERLLDTASVAPSDVAFIAHSTTQATNALLEGDVARVGVIGLTGRMGWIARVQQRFSSVMLAPGVQFAPTFAFVPADERAVVDAALDTFAKNGVEAIVASEAFGVDRPARERSIVERAQARGFFATSGHDVSSMYGLRARTRTAALNAAILPKMVRTARMTADAVARAKIAAPLMIMRSDGGVMDVREVERRPILTMLSGPAAGVAGALLYENVTDGIFLEVGGTSTDCSAIRAGRPQMRPARVGGHRTMLQTIDSRTLGIAGGSMPRCGGRDIIDVGPRSAHIAGCKYASFLTAEDFSGARVECFAPLAHDVADYIRFTLRDGTHATVTPTCASNMLGFVPSDAFASGNAEAARAAFALLAAELGANADALARRMLELGAHKIRACVDELTRDYELERDDVVLIGGGGGAAAIVPFFAQSHHYEYRLARDADVISPIGVALALVRDVVERTIVNPTPEDIASIRAEASDRVIASGASPDRIEVSVEIDSQKNRVRATASGATAMVEGAASGVATEPERRAIAARSLGATDADVRVVPCTEALCAYSFARDLRVLDERGVIRLALRDATVAQTTAAHLEADLRSTMEAATVFGDVGRALPALHLLHGARVADFSGLASIDQAVALALEEIRGRDSQASVTMFTIRALA
jgi:N-methylhydantoinase A